MENSPAVKKFIRERKYLFWYVKNPENVNHESLVEAVLNAFESAGMDKAVVDAVWEYAFDVYDKDCKEAEPESTTAENRDLMRSYLLGKRRKRK